MDLNRMSQGQQIAAVGGVALIIFLFLPWYDPFSGWESFSTFDLLCLIAGAVAIAAALAPGSDTAIPGVTRDGATALLGIVTLVLLVWLLLFDWPDATDRGIGAILAVPAAAAIAYGGYTAGRR